MKHVLDIPLTLHASLQMQERHIPSDVVKMVLTDFDCFRVSQCDEHNYVNLWRGPVRITLAREADTFVIVTVAWTDRCKEKMAA